jgi:hypothetical protein
MQGSPYFTYSRLDSNVRKKLIDPEFFFPCKRQQSASSWKIFAQVPGSDFEMIMLWTCAEFELSD